jgi:hypothetical protein
MAKEENAPVKPPEEKKGKFATVVPSSEVIGERDARRVVPKVVKVFDEGDLTPELIFKGPEKAKGVNSYVTVDGKKLRFDGKTGALLTLLLAFVLSFFVVTPPGFAQYGPGRTGLKGPATEAPLVTLDGVSATYGPATLLKVNYTKGKIYLGSGGIATTTPGQLTMIASKTNCDGPAYSSCNIVYAGPTGVVATTLAPATAFAAGNSVLAYVKTNATAVTNVQLSWQNTWGVGITAFMLSTGAITPAATSAAIQTVAQTFTVTGLTSTDQLALILQPAPTSLCPTTSVRATGTDTLSIYFTVLTAAACTPAAGTYNVLVVR